MDPDTAVQVDGSLVAFTENGAPALTAAGVAVRQTWEHVRGGRMTALSARLVGPRKPGKNVATLTAGLARPELKAEMQAILDEGRALGEDALRENLADLIVLTFETMDVLEGRGERTLFTWMFLELLRVCPSTMLMQLSNIPHYGSWKTVGLLYEQATVDFESASADERVLLDRLRSAIASTWARILLLDHAKLERYNAAVSAMDVSGSEAAAPTTAAVGTTAAATGGESAAVSSVPADGVAVAASVGEAAASARVPVVRRPRLSLAAKWAPRVGRAHDRASALARHIVYELDRLVQAGGASVLIRSTAGERAIVPTSTDTDGDTEMDDDSVFDFEKVALGIASASASTGSSSASSGKAPLPAYIPVGSSAVASAKRAAPTPAQNAAERRYRVTLSQLCGYLGVVEQQMAGGRWASIEATHIPSIANRKYRAALMNKAPGIPHKRNAEKDAGVRAGVSVPKVGPRSSDPDRVACATHVMAAIADTVAGVKGKKMKGARNQPHELVQLYLDAPTNPVERPDGSWDMGHIERDPMIEALWCSLVEDVKSKGALKAGVPLVDVSGSMTGIPMRVAIALGILMSKLQPKESSWYGRMITFSAEPKWHDISGCESLVDSVESVKDMEAGLSTNFGAAMQLLLQHALTARVPPEDMPAQLFVFSDMQFDEAAGVAEGSGHYGIRDAVQAGPDIEDSVFTYAGHDIRAAFRDAGYTPPQIVFWNLRSDGPPTFQAESSTPGVALMSGFSQACLKQFLEGGELVSEEAKAAAGAGASSSAVADPWTVLRTKLASERYYRIRALLSKWAEGVLVGYRFTPPAAVEGEAAVAGAKRKRKE